MMRRLAPPLVLIGVVGMLFLAFRSLPPETEDRYDSDILHTLAIAFGIWCLAMLIRTRMWDWLALAVLAAFVGDALFYAFLSGWPPEGWQRDWLRLLRACFVVSATMLIGQLVYDVGVWLYDAGVRLRLRWQAWRRRLDDGR